MRMRGRWLVAISSVIGLLWAAVTPAYADPVGDDSTSPFPEMNRITTWYRELDPADFFHSRRTRCLVLVTVGTELRHLEPGRIRLRG